MDAQAQQPQEQQQTSTKVFTVVETRHLLKILMNPKTLAMFKDNKQSHAFVWNYIFKCMKIKFPKFAKSTRQCYKKYENLKGKYFEIKRAQMNGEQRPYWLYYNEMDYIISHFPGHRPRINIEASNSATSTPNASNTPIDSANNANTSNNSDFSDIKPVRSSLSATNMDSNDAILTPFIPKKIQLLTLIRNTKPADFEKKSDGWELVLKKAQSKGLYPLNKTWLDFYYEIWISNVDDTISKWEGFSTGTRMVRYDEADKIMFDILKDDWNEFGNNSNSSIRIPTLRTLPGYIEKLKDLRQDNIVLEEIDNILPERTDTESSREAHFVNNTSNKSNRLENGHCFTEPIHHQSSPATVPSLLNAHESPLTHYRQQALQLKNQFIKTKMSAYVEKHNRKCYKMDLELYKIEKELGLPPSEFTQKFSQQQQQQQIVTDHTSNPNLNLPIPSMHPHPQQQQPQTQQIISNNLPNTGPQIQTVNGGGANANAVHSLNETFFNVDIKREMNFDDGGNFDFV
ncbi:uncharacterized protein LOC116349077 [Contarinia nasturtii]|uniref:uncharacterized protein LOC116349077 n=1 Tax=Contarinia nasturtii TaxID=265458 RepID=UPI0012D3729E|nr:uncharacterized protein LOC116349077 [Contarinia nasturtii]XP_031636206.1 uncharacterized protein LOC116349077 [Contarinia nasturtii]